jgi:hypothetical protein
VVLVEVPSSSTRPGIDGLKAQLLVQQLVRGRKDSSSHHLPSMLQLRRRLDSNRHHRLRSRKPPLGASGQPASHSSSAGPSTA